MRADDGNRATNDEMTVGKMMADETPIGVTTQRDALVDRLSDSMIATLDLFSVYLGDRLGYYHALATEGPVTSTELAVRTGAHERYTREWLEQQAVTGLLTVENQADDARLRRYRLPPGHVEPLTDPDSLLTMTPSIRSITSLVRAMPQLLAAFRTGGGVPFEDYGPDMAEGQAGSTRPLFLHLLTQAWLPAMPDIHELLQTKENARVADIGMGFGWSSLAIARAYPLVQVDGFDLDTASVEAARANAIAAGLSDRVTFQARDAGDPDLAGECLHDMSNPVATLRAMRRLVGDGGTILIVDERVADRFTAPGDASERLNYGYSILHCLPVGMVEQPSAGTGAVFRQSTLRHYAEEAGCRSVEVLPIEHSGYRFYRLTA
jgi:SAM-dependent methyltransferase